MKGRGKTWRSDWLFGYHIFLKIGGEKKGYQNENRTGESGDVCLKTDDPNYLFPLDIKRYIQSQERNVDEIQLKEKKKPVEEEDEEKRSKNNHEREGEE